LIIIVIFILYTFIDWCWQACSPYRFRRFGTHRRR
jgi:hypothetical protein